MNRFVWFVVSGMLSASLLVFAVAASIWPSAVLSSAVTGIVTWVGSILGLVGLPLALYGVDLAVREAKGASQAANATRRAIDAVRLQSDTSGLAYHNAQLQVVLQSIVTSTSLDFAHATLLSTARALELHASSRPAAQMVTFRRALRTAGDQLRLGVARNQNYSQVRAERSVGGLIKHVTLWEAEIKNNSENRSIDDAIA